MKQDDNTMHLAKDKIFISNPEKYDRIEIRNLSYEKETDFENGYNGNVIVGYHQEGKDVFYLSINSVDEEDFDSVCDKVEEMFGQDHKLVNLMIYNGDSTIYNLNP